MRVSIIAALAVAAFAVTSFAAETKTWCYPSQGCTTAIYDVTTEGLPGYTVSLKVSANDDAFSAVDWKDGGPRDYDFNLESAQHTYAWAGTYHIELRTEEITDCWQVPASCYDYEDVTFIAANPVAEEVAQSIAGVSTPSSHPDPNNDSVCDAADMAFAQLANK